MMRHHLLFPLTLFAAGVGMALSGCAHDPKSAVALLDTEWNLVEINGQAPAATAEDRHPSLQLSAETGAAQGSGGCNRYSAKYRRDGDRLEFERAMASKMGCAAEINQLEMAFFDALQAVASQRIAGDQLELIDADGKVILRLQAKP